MAQINFSISYCGRSDPEEDLAILKEIKEVVDRRIKELEDALSSSRVHSRGSDDSFLKIEVRDAKELLPVRVMNCLDSEWFNITFERLIEKTPNEILKVKNIGATSLKQLRSCLADHGVHLAGDKRWMEEYITRREKQ